MRSFTMRSGLVKAAVFSVSVLLVGACSDPNLINKTTYEGQKYTNTCDQFRNEIQGILDANSGPSNLRVAEADNSDMDIYSLEPGQFEQRGDTLYFRLVNDLEYGKYLQKGAAVIVKINFTAPEQLADIESNASGRIDSLVVDANYWNANRNPYFVYKVPVQQQLNGKQVTLNFSVVRLDKRGRIRKVYCNSQEVPLGPLDPACCTDQPFSQARPRSVVQLPEVTIDPVTYRYKGFVGTLDLIFPMMSVKFERKELNNVIQNYLQKYEEAGYKVKEVNLTGWASQGGTIQLNQNLSERRAAVVEQDLRKAMARRSPNDSVSISAQGRGEDWDRFELLVKTAVFTEEERNELLSIAGSADDPDAKEAQLRKLPYWNKLVKEVLTYCRHTFVTFMFDFAGQEGTVLGEVYGTQVPVISPELYSIATKENQIAAYTAGADAGAGIQTLNTIIDQNGFKSGNLFAMRSTYHFANRDLPSAISDMEQAVNMDQANPQYATALLAYRTDYASNYSMTERLRLLNTYNDYVARYPNNTTLANNRAVMMERVGYISGALAEYDRLMGAGRTAALTNNRGVARLKTNRVVEAEADFREAITQDPNLAEAHFNLAIVAAYKGFTDRAVQHLDQAIALRPELKSEVASNPVFRVMRDNAKFSKYR